MGLPFSVAVIMDLASKRHTAQPHPFPPSADAGGTSALAPLLLVLGGVVLVAAIAYLGYDMQRRRRDAFRLMATQLALTYSQDDPFGLLDLPFTLFTKGDDRSVENVVSGVWQQAAVTAFDYAYAEGSGKSRTDYRFDCAIVPIDADCPRLLIGPETALTSLAGAMSFHDLQFESEAFNDAYHVRCEVPKFASDVLDARMMEWLLADGSGYTFEVVGNRLLVAGPRIDPAALVGLLGVAHGFSRHVPTVVSSLYPG